MTALHLSTAAGDIEAIKRLLADAVDVNSRTILSGFTPLHIAVTSLQDGDPILDAVIRLLHEAGADLDARTYDSGLTALHLAVLRNRPAGVAVLLACGAGLHAQDGNGATALHGAAMHGHSHLVDHLLRAGARSDLADHHGRTPLDLARSHGHASVVQRLQAAR